MNIDNSKDQPHQHITKYLNNQKRLWGMTALNRESAITASGWKDSVNRKDFSQEEMKEFSDNVFLKLKSSIEKTECAVLEIGVGSGLLLQRIAPHVSRYDAVDISPEVLEVCQSFLDRKYTHIRFFQMFAHEIDSLDSKHDIIIINSVMQYFPDRDYVCDVLQKCRSNLNPGGVVFCGDIMDLEKKDEMIAYVTTGDVAQNNFGKLQFFDRAFFSDVAEKLFFSRCEITDKIYTIQNELSLFRFDVMLYN